jgi:hypothetical protein
MIMSEKEQFQASVRNWAHLTEEMGQMREAELIGMSEQQGIFRKGHAKES